MEISEAVGKDNIYIFGMTDKEVEERWRDGYNPYKYYEENHRLKRAVDYLKQGINGNDFSDIHRYLLVGDHGIADPYMCLADFGDYCRARYEMLNDYKNQREWAKKSLVNIASAGRLQLIQLLKNMLMKSGVIKAYK